VVAGNVANQTRGSIFAFIICLVALIFGFYLVLKGMNVQGFASIVGALGGVLCTFIYSRIEQRKERVEKQPHWNRADVDRIQQRINITPPNFCGVGIRFATGIFSGVMTYAFMADSEFLAC
jgi:amino acid permease